MNISKMLSDKIERRVGDLDHKLIAPKVVPALVAAEEETVKFAVEEAEEAARLLVAKAMEKALDRATRRVTAKRVIRAYVESFKGGVTAVTGRKTDDSVSGKGVQGGTPSSGGNRAAATS
jgi:hypothetical protein